MKRTIKKRRILINPTTVLCTLGFLAGTLYMLFDDYASLYGKILFAVVMAVGYYCCIESCVVSYCRLLEMEAFLGIDFDTEMANRGVTKFYYVDYDWYIISYWTIIHRDYIQDIGIAERHRTESGEYSGQSYTYREVPILCSNGKLIKLCNYTPRKLEDWFRIDRLLILGYSIAE